MTRIEVTRKTDNLNHQTWHFMYLENRHALVLTEYQKLTRSTAKHNFRAIEAFSTYRDKRGFDSNVLILDHLTLPDDVTAEAIQQFTESLRVQVGFK